MPITKISHRQKSELFTIVALIVVVAAMRLLPHPMNVTPIGALGLFAGALLPSRTAWLLPMGALQTTAAGFGLGAVPLALGISASIIAGALLGVNPIVTASVVGAVAAELAVPGLSLTAIALAIIGGWSVVIGLSPFITTIVFCAAIVGRPVWTVGPVWNGPYCAAVFGVWCALLVTLMATGTI